MYTSKQKGFSLIEALVAFLIISVGMLGIASLQVLSLKAGSTASLRTLAVLKTEEILERMRSNNRVLLTYGAGGPGINNGCNDHGGVIVNCIPDAMAQDDLFNWQADIANVFPPGTTGTIAYLTPVPGVQPLASVTITITWQERQTEDETMIAMSYSDSLLMPCEALLPPIDPGGTDPAC